MGFEPIGRYLGRLTADGGDYPFFESARPQNRSGELSVRLLA